MLRYTIIGAGENQAASKKTSGFPAPLMNLQINPFYEIDKFRRYHEQTGII